MKKATVISLDVPTNAAMLDSAFVDSRYTEDDAFLLRWRWRGNGAPISNRSPAFQANPMFFRTAGYQWCVGYPKHVWATQSGAPQSARVKREKKPL